LQLLYLHPADPLVANVATKKLFLLKRCGPIRN
jgi:hypothetical protein